MPAGHVGGRQLAVRRLLPGCGIVGTRPISRQLDGRASADVRGAGGCVAAGAWEQQLVLRQMNHLAALHAWTQDTCRCRRRLQPYHQPFSASTHELAAGMCLTHTCRQRRRGWWTKEGGDHSMCPARLAPTALRGYISPRDAAFAFTSPFNTQPLHPATRTHTSPPPHAPLSPLSASRQQSPPGRHVLHPGHRPRSRRALQRW